VGFRAAAELPGRITPRGNQVRIAELHVSGYRSIRDLQLPLGDVNVLIGPNGSGKTNLYRSVQLLAAAARGQLARSIALEGGMASVLWAGARKKGAVRMAVEVELEHHPLPSACEAPRGADRDLSAPPREATGGDAAGGPGRIERLTASFC